MVCTVFNCSKKYSSSISMAGISCGIGIYGQSIVRRKLMKLIAGAVG